MCIVCMCLVVWEENVRELLKEEETVMHSVVDYELLIVDKRINMEETRSLIISQLRLFQRCFVSMCVLPCSKFLLIKAQTEVTRLSLSWVYFLNFLFCVLSERILIMRI